MSAGTAALVSVVLLLLNGAFVVGEFAVTVARRTRLEQMASDGSAMARQALAAKREQNLMLAGTQLGVTICSLVLGAVAEPTLAHLIESGITQVWSSAPEALIHTIGFIVALSCVVFVHLVVGEMAPRSWAMTNPERSLTMIAPALRAFVFVFRPVIALLNWGAIGIAKMFSTKVDSAAATAHTLTDFKYMVGRSQEAADLDPEQRRLFRKSLELSGLDAADAMVPRRLVVAVAESASLDELARTAITTGRSRVVVYADDLDHVVGVAHIKGVLRRSPSEREGLTARDLARSALSVPEGTALEDVLWKMQEDHSHLAIVVDEHGVVGGIVTLEDVIEELIGDFFDETDRNQSSIHRTPDGAWVVSGDVRPDEIEARIELALPDGDWETVAGFVIAKLGEVPAAGESVDYHGYRFTVTALDGYAITRIRISRLVPDPIPSGEPEAAITAD